MPNVMPEILKGVMNMPAPQLFPVIVALEAENSELHTALSSLLRIASSWPCCSDSAASMRND
jgi:hypothetical protein